MTAPLRSGQLAAAAGVSQQTLRYYERRGLIEEPRRSNGGHRLYPPESVTVLRVIKAAQRLGFTLAEISDLLDVHRRGTGGLRTQAETKLAEVECRIADLTVIAQTLRSALAVGCDNLSECVHDLRCPVPFT